MVTQSFWDFLTQFKYCVNSVIVQGEFNSMYIKCEYNTALIAGGIESFCE
jgi:hypothetical protein